ncbi:hypothetical protein [Laribacter hongkongensis]|uniref:hypothetical protein n=1 Tax=Laribacter hongkongensis TaxID=168471 RepID=UPI001EFEB791|nr:hypothetical protein [Laribacter hongkongensis]MCG9076451.1 hypothetical protein [Laribacter hongkongensis]
MKAAGVQVDLAMDDTEQNNESRQAGPDSGQHGGTAVSGRQSEIKHANPYAISLPFSLLPGAVTYRSKAIRAWMHGVEADICQAQA